jgi:hypothetical protein
LQPAPSTCAVRLLAEHLGLECGRGWSGAIPVWRGRKNKFGSLIGKVVRLQLMSEAIHGTSQFFP